jgi:hypothetical protein
MLDLSRETPIPITEAHHYIPGDPSRPTVERWHLRGIRGVRLETALVGGRRYTTEEAIGRFLAACNGGQPVMPVTERRAAEIARAEAECQAAGI